MNVPLAVAGSGAAPAARLSVTHHDLMFFELYCRWRKRLDQSWPAAMLIQADKAWWVMYAYNINVLTPIFWVSVNLSCPQHIKTSPPGHVKISPDVSIP